MKPNMHSKNVSGYEDTGLGGGANKFMKVRQAIYRAAEVLAPVAGFGSAIAGVVTGNDQLTAMGMGMIMSTILPAIADGQVSGKIKEADKAVAMAVAKANVALSK